HANAARNTGEDAPSDDASERGELMDSLSIFTVYENPRDYPGRIVVGLFDVSVGGTLADPEPLAIVDTLDEARAAIKRVYPGAAWVQRNPSDDDPIVEGWL